MSDRPVDRTTIGPEVRRLISVVCCLLIMAASARPGWAQSTDAGPPATRSPVVLDKDDPSGEERLPESFEPGLWPTLGAIFPGAVIHGTGLWLAGAPEPASVLMRTQAVGILGTMLGFVGVYGTGASRRVIPAIYYPLLVSASLLVVPWFADIYGAAVGGRKAGPRLALPDIEAQAGYTYMYQPIFDYSHFAYARADLRLEPVRVSPIAWVAVDDDNQRFRLEGAYRLLGPGAGERDEPSDGTWLDIMSGASFHRWGSEDFQTLTVELQADGRLDLQRISPVLRGSFGELAVGAGAQAFGYAPEEVDLGEDLSALLLMRTAFGVYFGPADDAYGEAQLYYNHRHDGFAAGSGFNTSWDGLLGHAGVQGFYYLSEDWGLFADFKAGSVYMATAGVTWRHGGK